MRPSAVAALLAFVGVMGIARAAESPTAQEARWTAVVARFAEVLSGTRGREDLSKVIAAHAWMSPFDRNRSESATLLPLRLATKNVVSVRACLHPSVSSASDLVTDIAANGTIAESIRKQLIPPDARDLRLADATVARWFSIALDAQSNDPVALLALYEDGQGTAAARPTLNLVLIRGEFGTDGQPRITRILYGPLDAAVQ